MRVVVLLKDNTDTTRTVTDFLRDIERQTGHKLEVVDPESPEGVDMGIAYDILQWPAILALSDDGVMQKMWLGLPLPTINELSFYFR